MVPWDDTAVRVRAGLYPEILKFALPDPAAQNLLDEFQRQVTKTISRLGTRYSGDQTMLESLVFMREWLQGRLHDYRCGGTVPLGFPFETILGTDLRNDVMRSILRYFSLLPQGS